MVRSTVHLIYLHPAVRADPLWPPTSGRRVDISLKALTNCRLGMRTIPFELVGIDGDQNEANYANSPEKLPRIHEDKYAMSE
jgi:hypothetical protein